MDKESDEVNEGTVYYFLFLNTLIMHKVFYFPTLSLHRSFMNWDACVQTIFLSLQAS